MSINSFKIDKSLELRPQASPPVNPVVGEVYNDVNDGLLKFNGSSWEPIGASDPTNVQYIENPRAASNIDGAVAYADSPGSIPVDGVGGSPILTVTRTTVNPLRGDAGYLVTKDAANRQGEGFSIDFEIDRADRGQVLQISADTEVMSGVYNSGSFSTNSDLICYIYDITNAKLIEPTGMKIQEGFKFKAIFQASDSLSYRLIFHQSLTGVNAYTLQLNNIKVSPQAVANGYPSYSQRNYTPQGSLTTNVVYIGTHAREGDHIELQIQLAFTGANTQGVLTFTPAQILNGLGLTLDTSKLLGTGDFRQPVGEWGGVDAGTNGGWEGTVVWGGGVFECNYVTTNGTAINTAAGVPFTIASGDRFNLRVKLPIVGWETDTSSSTDIVWVNDVGAVQAFAVNPSTVPQGYLYCDGRQVSRTTYSDLFSMIGTSHGSGNGSSTFNLPDYRWKFLRGVGPVITATGSGTAASNNATFTAHGFNRTGIRVRLTSGTLSGLTATSYSSPTVGITDYWVIVIDANTLAFASSLANALAGTKVAISGANSAVISQAEDTNVANRMAAQPGANSGSNVGSIQYDMVQNHRHLMQGSYNGSGISSSGGYMVATPTSPNSFTTYVGEDETRPVNIAVSYFIKYLRTAAPQVTTTETVSASYYVSSGSSTTAANPYNFDTKVWDTHNAVTTGSSWKFTAPVSGQYEVVSSMHCGATTTNIIVYKNGSIYRVIDNTTTSDMGNGSCRISLLAGEYVDIRPSVTSTPTAPIDLTLQQSAYVEISRIGNYV